MLEETIKNMTPEEKKNALELVDSALDFITLMQYTNMINGMVSPVHDLKSLYENWLAIFLENFGDNDTEINKICNPESHYGFATDCFNDLVRLINYRYKQFKDFKDTINTLANTVSGEAAYNYVYNLVTSESSINQHAHKYGSREKYLKIFVDTGFVNIDSHLSKMVLDLIQTYRQQITFEIRCTNEIRGIFEYCQDGDYDYAFQFLSPEQIDGDSFKLIKDTYANIKKTDDTDAFIEAILKLLPKIYLSSENLVSMHSDPAKAQAIYDEALANRPSTTPATPLLTKDLLPPSPQNHPTYVKPQVNTPVTNTAVNSNSYSSAESSTPKADNTPDINIGNLVMEIEDDFSIASRGQVFCGTLTDSVSVGDIIEILDVNQQILESNVSVTGIEYEHKMWQKAEAGLNVSILVRMKNPKFAKDALYLRKISSSNAATIQASATNNNPDINIGNLVMEIEDEFSISGLGQVFRGNLTDTVSVGDKINILDNNQVIIENNITIEKIHYGGTMWQKAEPGLNAGILVKMKNPELAKYGCYLRITSRSTAPVQASAIANSATLANRCPHCGGEYKGLFTKKCSVCGRKKQ